MTFQKTSIALAVLALSSTIPFAADAAPTVSITAPTANQNVSGVLQGSACAVTGTNIARVRFYFDTTLMSTDDAAPWQCNIDTRQFPNGRHRIRVVAYDSAGAANDTSVYFYVQNGTVTPPPPTPPANQPPTVSFKVPKNGQQVSGTLNDSTCEALATDDKGVKQVQFFLGSSALGTEFGAPYTCGVDTKKFANGTHTLKAVATDTNGASTTSQISINIQNLVANTPPTVALTAPGAGASLSGTAVGYGANASDPGGSVAKVEFYLAPSTQTAGALAPFATKTSAPYSGTLDTTKVANGSYTLMAVATDNLGAAATTQRPVTVDNPIPVPPVAAADILTRASADNPFAQQSGYTAQVINTYTPASAIPESGIRGSALPDGDTLRFGKAADPTNSALKALAFQVTSTDPTTSGGKRTELAVEPNIEHNKVYWIAFSVYVHDWGTLGANDLALFGTQLHQGNNQLKVGGPAFGLYTKQNGRSFRVRGRYSEAATPSESNATNVEFTDYPMPFGRWTDFVLRFKENTSGNGLLQVWMDGVQIADYQGSLGYNTGQRDYIKFGYYNWSLSTMSSTPRKVLMRSPTIVADPTGSTYKHEQLRALVSADAAGQ